MVWSVGKKAVGEESETGGQNKQFTVRLGTTFWRSDRSRTMHTILSKEGIVTL
jgi:hypothetical protein